ncbi:MAG: PEP-CTERM sorting domain-containing protein, partial [Planctomycetota bacterium]
LMLQKTSRFSWSLVGAIIVLAPGLGIQAQVTDEGPLPRHDVENEHVVGLLDHSNFRFVGRSNPNGPYVENSRNWTDLYGYEYDGDDPAFAGRRFAYVSTGGFGRTGGFVNEHSGGVAIFDVTADDNPTYLGTYQPPCERPSGDCFFLIRDIEIHDGVGYFSSDNGSRFNGGVFTVDLRANPEQPPLLAHLNSFNNQGLNAVHEIGLDVVSDTEAYLYANDSVNSGRVSVYDISNPRTSIDRTAQLFNVSTHGVYADEGVLYVAGDNTVTLFDVSDVGNGNIPEIGQFGAPGGFTHSSWPDRYVNDMGETRDVLYVTHEQDGTDLQVWDVTDILSGTDPNGAFQIAAVSNVDLAMEQGVGFATNVHNVFLVDDLLFTSWTAAGMVVLDVSDPENPVVIDTYDTNVVEADSNFIGAFGVNASLGMDRVLISDRANGLWVVDVSGVVPEPRGMLGLVAGLLWAWSRGRRRRQTA